MKDAGVTYQRSLVDWFAARRLPVKRNGLVLMSDVVIMLLSPTTGLTSEVVISHC
jgi:hypothetical protein